MSDTDILAALDGWLGGYSQATTEMPVVTKPVNQVSTVTKVVTTETLPDKAVTRVTPVTPKIINSESDNETYTQIPEKSAARVMDLDFSPVSVKTQDIGDWENLINWWLDHIEEQDPELRNTCLNQCRQDDEARRYFLSHAILEFGKSKRESND